VFCVYSLSGRDLDFEAMVFLEGGSGVLLSCLGIYNKHILFLPHSTMTDPQPLVFNYFKVCMCMSNPKPQLY
jgi:hypothetical protein